MKKFLADAALSWKTEVNRNTFDISKKHFASYNFGKIYPMYVRHVQPNETIKIRPGMSLELDPLTHELYNDVKCNTAYFYVRTRSLWSSWRKFMRQDPTKSSAVDHPTIAQEGWLSVGSLGNHMGIPVARYGVFDGNSTTTFSQPGVSTLAALDNYNPDVFNLNVYQPWVRRDFSTMVNTPYGTPCFAPINFNASADGNNRYPARHHIDPLNVYTDVSDKYLTLGDQLKYEGDYHTHGIVVGGGFTSLVSNDFKLFLPHINFVSPSTSKVVNFDGTLVVYLYAGSDIEHASYISEVSLPCSGDSVVNGSWSYGTSVERTVSTLNGNLTLSTSDYCLDFDSDFVDEVQKAQQSYGNVYFVILPEVQSVASSNSYLQLDNRVNTFAVHNTTAGSVFLSAIDATIYNFTAGFYGYPRYSSTSEVNTVIDSPFEGTNPALPLNVLPFRAYRNIYNSHFRDKIHDPLRDANGDIMTDQYVEYMGDGADTITKLDFEYCRFAPDLFNTCLPTPTMGDDVHRPLVGITVGADPSSATLYYQENGEAYSIQTSIHHNDNGTDTITKVNSTTHSEPNDTLTYLTLKDAVQYGISLQDLQNTQALTKWYEASYRGLGRFEYDKFVEAHFGKSPALKENLAAEYLGGSTVFVNSFKVINQSASGDSAQPLGSMAGLANFSQKEDDISCFCDEDGYVMGVCWFTCDNVNSQSIDDMWYLRQPSDYASTEFADLGCAPVRLKTIAPLQVNPEHYEDVFGYQRIYGDKVFASDTVAGDFLTLKSDYLMQRRFKDTPQLTADFAKMHPNDFTNVFASENTYDKIHGVWNFDVTISTWLQQTPNAQII